MCIVKSGCRLFFFDTHFPHELIILMFFSGNVLPNPGPAHGNFGCIASDLTFSFFFVNANPWASCNNLSLLHKPVTSWECTVVIVLLSLNHSSRKALALKS